MHDWSLRQEKQEGINDSAPTVPETPAAASAADEPEPTEKEPLKEICWHINSNSFSKNESRDGYDHDGSMK